MSTFRRSGIGSFTRGGQTTIQYLRMIFQVIKQFTAACVIIFGCIFAAMFVINTSPYERYVGMYWGTARVAAGGLKRPHMIFNFRLPDGSTVPVTARSLTTNKGIQVIVDQLTHETAAALIYAAIVSLLALGAGVKFIYKTGSRQIKDEFVRGGDLADADELKKIIEKKEEVGVITVGGIPIPIAFEPAHFLFCGGPGTGKSVALKAILWAFRKAGLRVVVYDITGDFVKLFYREGKDVILNPLDERTAHWDIWCDAKEEWDYDAIAHSLIPDSAMGKDPMWALAVRIVFAEIAKKVNREGDPTNKLLMKYLLEVSKEEVISYIKDTDAAAILDEDGERVVTSIRTMLATYAKPFRYLPEREGEGFSIRKWIRGEEDGSWIFITTKEEQKEAVKPLITVWLDIAAAAILSLTPDRQRRIWQSIDELTTLNKLPSLLNTLTNSRKYGGSFLLGFQNYPQLKAVYGKDGADALCEACSTWIIFRANGEETGEWASKGLGKKEVLETTEGISYGVTDLRDGVTLNRTKKPDTIVLSTEINGLPDLHGFLRLGRGYPVGRFVLTHRDYKEIAVDFIRREERTARADKYVGSIFHKEPVTEEISEKPNDPSPESALKVVPNSDQETASTIDYREI